HARDDPWRFPAPGRPGAATCAFRVARADTRWQAADAAGPGSLAGRSRQSAHAAGDGESHLAEVFWPRTGGHARGLWQARNSAFASRVTGLAGPPVHGTRLEHESAAQADCDLG